MIVSASLNTPHEKNPGRQKSTGHRLSVPTPAARKQSGMPPLPPNLSKAPLKSSSSYSRKLSNGDDPMAKAMKPGTNPNGYPPPSKSSSQSGGSYHHHHHHRNKSRNMKSSSGPVHPKSGASNAIIGGINVNNLIPPPPPPTSAPGPAWHIGF